MLAWLHQQYLGNPPKYLKLPPVCFSFLRYGTNSVRAVLFSSFNLTQRGCFAAVSEAFFLPARNLIMCERRMLEIVWREYCYTYT